MVTINKSRFFYAIIIIMIVDLIIDGIDDFGTKLYLIHLIRSLVIIGLALIFSISFKKTKRNK
ncbi:MAG TPA: hypothetical protein VJ438_01805 [Candidatus Nanoarchaeia archaeon]|nr:hypothetical protein [Candidatus Nanoarchaeia archaeon]